MNTRDFLRYVLPSTGYFFIATFTKLRNGNDWLRHLAADSIERAAAIAEELEDRGMTVYHACAAYKQDKVDTGTLTSKNTPKYVYRTQDNALAARSFWIDIDIGKTDKNTGEPRGHQTRESALAALDVFVETYGLPYPLVVNSGYGFHLYWSLTKEISAGKWSKLAAIFNEMAQRVNLQHDSACTTDIARILRPVGTTNRKQDTGAPVEVVGDVPEQIDRDAFATIIVDWAKDNNYKLVEKKPVVQNDLAYTPDYPPSSAYEIIKHCKQIADIAAVRSDHVDEPLWYAMLSVICCTVEGDALCHEWSSGDDRYNYDQTQFKIDKWRNKPTSCAQWEKLNPKGCEGCPSKGKVVGPIMLGQVLPEPAPVVIEVEEGVVEEKPVEFPEDMAHMFSWNGTSLMRRVVGDKDEDAAQVKAFCEILFMPTNYFRDPRTGHYRVIWSATERNGKTRDFELSGAAMGVGGITLAKELGEQGIVALNGQKKHMEAYVTSWFNSLRKRTEETSVYYQYGWQKDWSFILGRYQFLPNGEIKKVRLTGNAAIQMYVDAFEPKGSAQAWVDLVDRVYNYEGQEQYQFTLGIGFGAPLIRLFENYGGLIVNGYSPEKGMGKSTAGKLALGIYGDPKILVRTKQQTTTKAFNAHCGVMNSLPVMLDEATNVEPKALSEIAYTFSQGTPGQGLNPDGSMRTTLHSWSTIMCTNANRSLINVVGAGKTNADAEMGRILEYEFTRISKLSKEEADEALAQAETIYGHVGRTYIEYIVTHREEVAELLRKAQKALDKRIGATVADRFHSIGVAAIIVGLTIAKKLKLVSFDLVRLTDWIVLRTRNLHDRIQDNLPPMTSVFGTMVAEMASGIIVTGTEGDSRSNGKAAIVLQHPKGAVTGRLIQDTNTLYLQQSLIRQWCAKNQADYGAMWAEVVNLGWASPDVVNFSLGKGTKDYALPPSRCWKLDAAKMDGDAVPAEARDKIYAIK